MGLSECLSFLWTWGGLAEVPRCFLKNDGVRGNRGGDNCSLEKQAVLLGPEKYEVRNHFEVLFQSSFCCAFSFYGKHVAMLPCSVHTIKERHRCVCVLENKQIQIPFNSQIMRPGSSNYFSVHDPLPSYNEIMREEKNTSWDRRDDP